MSDMEMSTWISKMPSVLRATASCIKGVHEKQVKTEKLVQMGEDEGDMTTKCTMVLLSTWFQASTGCRGAYPLQIRGELLYFLL